MLTFLAEWPVWFTFAVFFFFTIGILPIGRRYFEGFPYNISMASAYGDVALLCIAMIGADILSKNGPGLLGDHQLYLGTATVIFGFVYGVATGGVKKNTVMDAYHNFFVVPLLVYLVVLTALPLIVAYGSTTEIIGAGFFGAVWGALMRYDFQGGRLQQCVWLKKNGRVTQV